MQLISVNTGSEQPIQIGARTDITGIFKTSSSGPVEVTPLGLVNDAVMDKESHGGPDQAVYVYTTPDYAWWSAEMGSEIAPGTFGENLTISGMESARLSVGDVLRVGAVTLQVTAPRIPCSTLAARMGDMGFVKRFRAAGRPGVYCRVLQPGTVRAGDPVTWEPYTGETVTIQEMYEEHYEPSERKDVLRRYLNAPIAIRERQRKEARLEKLLAGAAGS